MKGWPYAACVALLVTALPTSAFAQRELHWERLAVAAHLNADGSLQVAETQTMVFTGDWNGGERKFNIRPRQKLSFTGIYRDVGGQWRELTADPDLDSVDDYAWTDDKTLRWRSRLQSDPVFDHTNIRYELRYVLSGILLKNGDQYLLDHDFAFPDRAGVIDRFDLQLTVDPAWQPLAEIRPLYAMSGLPPRQSYVLKVPLRFTGSGAPSFLDLSRPPQIRAAVLVLLGVTVLAVVWLFMEERAKGRFERLDEAHVDEGWLREHILNHPAEVVGAAWDDSIGQPEVVALLARLTSERKLASEVSGSGKSSSMTLHLKVDRSKLEGYERTLVDKLFFGSRTTTSTDDVKSHYKKEGFSPVTVIEKDLTEKVKTSFPFGEVVRTFRVETLIVFLAGVALLGIAWFTTDFSTAALVLLPMGTALVAGLGALPGAAFRRRIDWGLSNALLCMIPAYVVALAVAAFIWFFAGTGSVELPTVVLWGIVALALAATNNTINALKSRQKRAGLEARKTLAAARAYFLSELRKPQPALRDEWYPWVLAFGLARQMDDWSAQSTHTAQSGSRSLSTSTTSGASSSSSTWTGFGGGRSGGAGAGASWAAAAGGMAAGVSPPSSSGSGGGGGGGGGGGSSGGGGGGGW